MVTNIYSDLRSFQFFFYKYIWTFIRVKFVWTNLFGHSSLSVLECKNWKNIWIYLQFSLQIFIQTFVRVNFSIRIFSDIHLCSFFMSIYSNIRLWQNFHECHTLVQMFKCSDIQTFKCKCSNVRLFKCSNVQIVKCSNIQMVKCSNIQMFTCQVSNVKCQISIK